MPHDESTSLSSLRPKQSAVITRVAASDASLLRHLDELDLVPGIRIEVEDYSPYDHNLTIEVGRKSFVLGLNITSKIFVEVIK